MSLNTTDYSADELHPPAWLNEEFLLDVLRHCEKHDVIDLQEVKFSPATAKNDHYASIMFRAVINYAIKGQMKEKSLILKTMPEVEGDKKKFLKDTHIFETEIGMYTQVIPKFEEILSSAGDYTKFGPPCLYHSLSPKKIIVFEDMIPLDYTVLRTRQTNFEETKAIYNKIAKWHAVSYKLNLEQPELFRDYKNHVFSELDVEGNEFFMDGITNFIEMLEEHTDLAQYAQYFKPMKSTIFEHVNASFSEFTKNPQSSAYYVLCHGDFHHKNMLFKYDKSSLGLRDALLIDYQMCNVGPIVNDLINSIYMLMDSKQRLENLDELLYFYFSTFQETLQKIGFNGEMPKIIEFRKQLMSHRYLAMYMFISFLPLLYAIHSTENDLGEILHTAEVRKAAFRNPVYVNEVRKLLPIYLRLGYLEY